MTTDVDPADGLFERAQELERLAHAVACGRSGHGATVVVGAPPGVGKSRLCAVVRHQARREGMEVLSAVASPLDRDVPFGLARRLLDHRLARTGDGERTTWGGGPAAAAMSLFVAGDGNRDESAIVYGLYWLTVALSDAHPLALVVDDVQWADRSSLRFLAYLAERIDGLSVTLVVAGRPGEGEVADLVRHLEAAPGAVAVALRPLSQAGVAAMVRQVELPEADDAFCAACWTATEGNPFVVTELLATFAAEGWTASGGAVARVATLTPQVVLKAHLAHLATLPPPAVRLVRAATVLGDEVPLRLAASLAGLDLHDAATAADALAAAGIVARGDPLRFEHPLIRAAVYDDLPSGARSVAHAAAARVLDEDGEQADRVAAHLLAAPLGGDPWVVEQLRRAAAEAAGHGAHPTAVRLLERAAAEPPRRGETSAVLRELGRAQLAAGVPEGLGTLQSAVERAAGRCDRARALDDLGMAWFARGQLADATAAFDRGLRELGDADPQLAREMEARYVGAASGTGSLTGSDRVRLDRLLAGYAGGDLPAERAVLAAMALRAALTGAPAAEFGPLALRSIGDEAAAAAGGETTIHLVSSVIALLFADELDACRRLVDDALDHARRAGAGGSFAAVCSLRAWPLYLTGNVVEAIADAELALQAGTGGPYQPFGATHTILVHAYLEAGDLRAARRTIEQAERDAQDQPSLEFVVPHAARGRLKLAEGDAAGALEDLCTQGRLLGELGFANYPIPWRPTAALAALALGDRGRAETLVAEELALADRLGTARARGTALRAAGLVAGGTEGVALLEEAVAVLERSPARLELARALIDLGALGRRAGDRRCAREPLARGRDLANRFGAGALVAQATAELGATGARPRRLRTTGVGALTPSERRVALMAAGGMTNPQIAQALFVTRKAVEFHLSNVYLKLGVTSRSALPAALAGADVAPDQPAVLGTRAVRGQPAVPA